MIGKRQLRAHEVLMRILGLLVLGIIIWNFIKNRRENSFFKRVKGKAQR